MKKQLSLLLLIVAAGNMLNAQSGNATYIEAEPVATNDNGSSNFIGSLNETVSLAPGNHTIEVRYTISSMYNLNA